MRVVLAHMGVFALASIAPTVLGAVGIDAAFGADTGPVVEVVAAEQTIAAIELLAAIGRRKDAADAAFCLAAKVVVDAFTVAANLALAATAVARAVGAVGTGRAVVIGAAGIERDAFVIAALLVLTTGAKAFAVVAGLAWTLAVLGGAAGFDGDAGVTAALLALGACCGADASIAE